MPAMNYFLNDHYLMAGTSVTSNNQYLMARTSVTSGDQLMTGTVLTSRVQL